MSCTKYARSLEKLTKCICPLCGKEHKMWIFWTGRAKVPPKHCEKCKANRIDAPMSPEYDYNQCYVPRR